MKSITANLSINEKQMESFYSLFNPFLNRCGNCLEYEEYLFEELSMAFSQAAFPVAKSIIANWPSVNMLARVLSGDGEVWSEQTYLHKKSLDVFTRLLRERPATEYGQTTTLIGLLFACIAKPSMSVENLLSIEKNIRQDIYELRRSEGRSNRLEDEEITDVSYYAKTLMNKFNNVRNLFEQFNKMDLNEIYNLDATFFDFYFIMQFLAMSGDKNPFMKWTIARYNDVEHESHYRYLSSRLRYFILNFYNIEDSMKENEEWAYVKFNLAEEA